MGRNAPAILLSVLVGLLVVAGALLYQAYLEVDAERAALAAKVGGLEGDVAAARARLADLEASVTSLTAEAARLHEQNLRLHRSGWGTGKGS
jgi:cell division protein FtsB